MVAKASVMSPAGRSHKYLIMLCNEKTHRDIKVHAALSGLSVQDYMLGLIRKELETSVKPPRVTKRK